MRSPTVSVGKNRLLRESLLQAGIKPGIGHRGRHVTPSPMLSSIDEELRVCWFAELPLELN